MLQYLRANLIATFRNTLNNTKDPVMMKRASRLLVSAPVDIEFELQVLETAIDLTSNMLRTKFATTIEEDLNIL